MLTSVGQWSEIQELREKLVDACLLKPVRQSQLLNTLATVLAKNTSIQLVDSPAPVTGVVNSAPPASLGAGLRVLVAEDNAVNQKVAVRMLERLGLRPDVAGNGLEALDLCASIPYDLIFMDCQMPEMDGYMATKIIRSRETSGRRTPIIAMTAEAMHGTRERCLAAGMDDYIAKPVRLDALRTAIEDWVPFARGVRPAASKTHESVPTMSREC
jgi:CheY-like chemotaxis protein